MKKVAIVGVEGSGKTVMLAGLGELYSRPDERGIFLTPKNFTTASYVAEKITRMRKGEWPTATAEDVLQGLDWTLKCKDFEGGRPMDVCELSCLDFAGEVYRNAFGIAAEASEKATAEVEALKRYVREADFLIVLINLRDVIAKGLTDARVRESVWITKSILQFALESDERIKEPRAAIVLSQADSYADTIASCGGAKEVLTEYLRDVANNYDWLDIFSVSAVDKTILDDGGLLVPASDFTSTDLKTLVNWICRGLKGAPIGEEPPPKLKKVAKAEPKAAKGFWEAYWQTVRRARDIDGRSGRNELWRFVGGNALGLVALAICLDSSAGRELPEIFHVAACLAFLGICVLPMFSLILRRFNDLGFPRRSLLLLFIPIINLLVGAWLLFGKSADGYNAHGAKPE